MEIKITEQDGNVLAAVTGRIDALTCESFQQQALSALADAGEKMVLDCAGLTYISSAGLRSLLVLATCAQRKQTEVVLYRVQYLVREVLEMSGFDSFFTLQDK